MADSRSYSKSQSLHRLNQSYANSQVTHILCRSLVFLFFLIAVPLFPSQAPEFMSHTLLTKFWELLHLLFIGLAVCYGLFSRRNADLEFESTHSNSFDDSQSSFVSRIFHVSPIFDDGSEIQSLSDEKNVYQSWNSQFFKGDSRFSNFTVPVDNDGSKTITDEQIQNEFCRGSENTSEISLEQDENSVLQAWTSQYFQGESVVVLSQRNYASDQRGETRIGGDFQPLGLPVRSLNSRIGNPNSEHQFSNGIQPDSSLIGSSNCSSKIMEEENFCDQGPVNLEKLNENSFSTSQNPSLSRSARPKLRERVVPLSNHSHLRPLSVDETQFESFKSQSFRSNASFSSQTSSISNWPELLSPSLTSCSNSSNSGSEEPVKMKEREATLSPLATQSPQASKNREAPLNAFHLRRYSSGSLFQKDTQKVTKADSKDSSHKRSEDGQGSSKPDKKSANIVKASSRGKSVRTIRSSACTPEEEKVSKIHKNDNLAKGYDVDVAKNEVLSGFSKKNGDSHRKVPQSTIAEKREKKEALEKVKMESGQEPESGIDNIEVRMDNGAPTSFTSESGSGHDSDEVDKKAGEFIAKFREQIRLQKVASVERSKGLRMSGK